MDIKTAAAQGIDRVRMAKWSHPMDHIKIDIIDGRPGAWAHLYCPFNKECNGRDPVDMIVGQVDCTDEWEAYTGPLPESDEYKAAQAAYEGSLAARGDPPA